MILMNMMPCNNCKNYEGIKQPDGTESDEYIACSASKTGRANALIKTNGKELTCEKHVEKYDD